MAPVNAGPLGKVPRGLVFAGAGLAGVLGYLWWRNRQASSPSSTTGPVNTATEGLAAVGLPSTSQASAVPPVTPAPTGSGQVIPIGLPPNKRGGEAGGILTGPGNQRSRNLRAATIPLSSPALNQPAQPSAGSTVLATLPPRAIFPGSPGAQLVWPFPGGPKASEFRRIDQGWDLQYPGTRPTPVLAIAPGIAGVAHDPSGFGVSYPTETFNRPVAGYTGAYYGHVQPVLVPGTRVRAGQIIGETFGPTSGGDAAGTPNWLEVGFLRNGQYPVFGQGSAMRAALLNARAAVQRVIKPAVPPPGAPRTLPLLPPPIKPRPVTPRARAKPTPKLRNPRGPLAVPFAPAAGRLPAPRRAPARRPARRARRTTPRQLIPFL